jgi:hypothetical protein
MGAESPGLTKISRRTGGAKWWRLNHVNRVTKEARAKHTNICPQRHSLAAQVAFQDFFLFFIFDVHRYL